MTIQTASELIKYLYQRIMKSVELRKYDAFSIEEYFRKQGYQVGHNNRIYIYDLGGLPHIIKIGNHCTIGIGVTFLTHDGGGWIFTEEVPSIQKFGPIVILDNCFLGYRSTILPNVTIGPNSIVGACSVVTKDVPANRIYAGNPAREICSVDEYRIKIQKIWKRQKPVNYLNDLKDGVTYAPRDIEKAKIRDLTLLSEHLLKLFKEEKGIQF